MKRKQYHPSVKLAVALKLEHEFLSADFIKSIAPSTTHGWKGFKNEHLVGHEFARTIDENLTDIQWYYDYSSQRDRKMIKSCLLVKHFFVNTFSKKDLQKTLRENKHKVVGLIDGLINKSELKLKTICKIIGVTVNTFHNWKHEVLFKCHSSVLNLCPKRHPLQATSQEVGIMKKLLTDPLKLHWSIASIQGYAIKHKLCYFAVSTWYKYNKLLMIRKGLFKTGKKPSYSPLRAAYVNEIWHADITVFKTLDGIRHFIYTVKDNFSRKTLAWKLASKVSANIRMETIKDALEFTFGSKAQSSLRLITDGGPENVNATIREFTIKAGQNCQVDINHQIALKDIEQSNSMVEASYLTLKSRYLYTKQIHNGDQLLKELEFFFEDHDNVKPHYAHKIYTPNEVFYGADPNISLSEVYAVARQKRREVNKISNCGVC
ncbi:MAG: transposase family protein [Fluviicola sp.]|nr:transposase family protein [Fluviicola sp.]